MTNDCLPDHWPAESDWTNVLQHHFASESFQSLLSFVREQRSRYQVCPPAENVYQAFALCGFQQTRVVILGQDPYHGPGQAHGLSFSVARGVKIPPSLKNIFKELHDDLGIDNLGIDNLGIDKLGIDKLGIDKLGIDKLEIDNLNIDNLNINAQKHGNLENWARQGVLLLNTVLTVRLHKANSHRNQGWEAFTDCVIESLGARQQPTVFLFWGNPAIAKKTLVDLRQHRVIESSHPSPLSARRSFFGSRPFSKANQFLESKGLSKVDWHV